MYNGLKTLQSHAYNLWWSFAQRAWEGIIAGNLLFIGLWDLFGPYVFPPEAQGELPNWIFKAYGFYMVIASVLILLAILRPHTIWARRVERTGMMLTGITSSTMAVLIICEQNAVESHISGHVVNYFVGTLIMLAVGSFSRYIFLGMKEYRYRIIPKIEKEILPLLKVDDCPLKDKV